MKEKRRHKRIPVEGVYGKIFKTLLNVELLNLSIGGVAIKLNNSLSIGKEYTIQLMDKGKPIELKGTVAWCVMKESGKDSADKSVNVYHAGIKLDDIFTDKTSSLFDFIEANKSMPSKMRLRGMRVAIKSNKNAVLCEPSGYKVKTISPFGMLIETTQMMNPEERFPMELFLKDISPFKTRLHEMHEDALIKDIILKSGKVVKFVGRVVSCSEANSGPNRYDVGLELLEMRAKDWANLTEFIRSISIVK